MSPLGMGVIAFACLVLAAIGWGSAWKTLKWLGNAEDLLELIRDETNWHPGDTPTFGFPRSLLEVQGYKRRSPRRQAT